MDGSLKSFPHPTCMLNTLKPSFGQLWRSYRRTTVYLGHKSSMALSDNTCMCCKFSLSDPNKRPSFKLGWQDSHIWGNKNQLLDLVSHASVERNSLPRVERGELFPHFQEKTWSLPQSDHYLGNSKTSLDIGLSMLTRSYDKGGF